MKEEWKNIFQSRWLKVVLVAIILIPSLYAGIFLGSMWDPYGNVDKLPVAVVNEDQTVDFQANQLAIGDELAANLVNSDAMSFQLVSQQAANEGLKDGLYYMVITIPEDFSKNATTLLDKNPKSMVLNYQTNPGKNYIASIMSNSAINQIKEQVSSQVTQIYVQTIFEQIDKLSNGYLQAGLGSDDLSLGMQQLKDGSQELNENLQLLADSTLTFSDGSNTFFKGLQDYLNGVSVVNQGLESLNHGHNALNQAIAPLKDGTNHLLKGSDSLNEAIVDYTEAINQIYQGSDRLINNNQTIQEAMASLQNGTDQLLMSSQQLTDGIQTLNNKLDNNLTSNKQTEILQVNDSNNTLNQATLLLENLLSTSQSSALASKWMTHPLSSEEASLISNDQAMITLLTTTSYQELVNQVTTNNQQVISSLNDGLKQIDYASKKLLDGSQAINSGIIQLDKTFEEKVMVGLNDYLNAASTINQSLKQLNANNSLLVGGSNELHQGIKELVNQTPELFSGIDKLNEACQTLLQGTNRLLTNNDPLLQGAFKLNDGSKQIASGASQLYNGSVKLDEGLNQVANGINTLGQSLKQGAKDSNLTTNQQTYLMAANPVSTCHSEISTVANNGHAMAPYMISVALFVAALALTLMYPIRQGIKEAKSPFKYWLGKASVIYPVVMVSAIGVITVLYLILDFRPQQLLMTYIFAVVVAITFMAIVFLISLTTGFIGEFLLLIFMIINLGGSAGTYPLETSSRFYQIIHPFMPYTYSVDGFRKVISSPSASITLEIIILMGIFIICSIFSIVYYRHKNKQDRHLISQAFIKVNE